MLKVDTGAFLDDFDAEARTHPTLTVEKKNKKPKPAEQKRKRVKFLSN